MRLPLGWQYGHGARCPAVADAAPTAQQKVGEGPGQEAAGFRVPLQVEACDGCGSRPSAEGRGRALVLA